MRQSSIRLNTVEGLLVRLDFFLPIPRGNIQTPDACVQWRSRRRLSRDTRTEVINYRTSPSSLQNAIYAVSRHVIKLGSSPSLVCIQPQIKQQQQQQDTIYLKSMKRLVLKTPPVRTFLSR
ncbi:unnamed protein product [Ectocarpus sp. 6 AP-2014]